MLKLQQDLKPYMGLLKTSKFFVFLILLLWIPGYALAEPVKLQYKGNPGLWFPSEESKVVLADIEEFYRIKPQIGLLEGKLQIKDIRIDNLKKQVVAMESAKGIAKKALEASIRQERRLQDKLDAWYNSPFLWIGVGVVSTIVVEVVAVLVLKEVD